MSLFIFSYKNKFRRLVVWITEWRWFDTVVISLILIGSVCQAIYKYQGGDENKEYNQTLDTIMTSTSVFFVFEACLKIVAQGLYRHKNAYLKDGWNIVDFIVVLTSLLELITEVLASKSEG